MSVYEKLLAVQSELKAPKGQYNSFGKYKYRSCEDIMEAVKPILAKNKAVILLDDEIREIGGRFYVNATAQFFDCEDGNFIETRAFAREDESKKGMDGAQVTGSTSSYARKYALNGLLAIDDTKDTDATNTHGNEEPTAIIKANNHYICEDCGNEISAFSEAWPAERVATAYKKRYGKYLCADCAKKIGHANG